MASLIYSTIWLSGRHNGFEIMRCRIDLRPQKSPLTNYMPLLIPLLYFVGLFGFVTSSSTTRLYYGWAPRLTFESFKCCHTQDRVGRPWRLSQPVTLYWHRHKQWGAGGHSGDRTWDLLTRSCALYRLSYRAHQPHSYAKLVHVLNYGHFGIMSVR